MIEVATKINSTIDKEVERKIIVTKSQNTAYNIVKRAFDIISGLIGIIILVPLTLLVLFIRAIYKENDGPIFYKHTRVGKDGKLFELYKFRTMYVDADERLQELLEKDDKVREEWERNRKIDNDPRVTKVGKLLRKTSLDEFPNFINIFTGDLSLIGPRAVVPSELEMFGDSKEKILSVKPGITGNWAVNGRSNTTYQERVELEAYYARNASIKLDIKIFLKTFLVVFKRIGAK